MKNVKSLLLVAIIAIAQACNSASNDSVTAANDANDKKDTTAAVKMNDTTSTVATPVNTTPVDKNDAEFAVAATSGGMMEVELGNYAQQNAASQRVKDFGAMMVKDHTAAGDELKSMARQKNVTLPETMSNDHQKKTDDLNKKTGKDFDKAYMKAMVDGHQSTVNDFEKASKDTKDADVKAWVDKTLPTLKMHLDSAKAIQKTLR